MRMADQWRDRLKQALDASGKSMRAVSLEIGCSTSYLFQVISHGKEPTIDRIMRLADALGVSLPWLLYGYEMSHQEEQLLRAVSQLSPKQRQSFLELASTLTGKDIG
jgi:transcriptional regulator with XRE-family HTH domain